MFENWLAKLTEPFTSILDQHNTLSYMAALVFLLVAVIVSRLFRKRRRINLRALFRLVTKKNVWLHRSSILDYKLYVVNLVLMVFFLGYFSVGMDFWSGFFTSILTFLFGPAQPTIETNWWIFGSIIAVEILALDFGYWFGHFAMHKSPILWEFHKVHHSAEVMTPATEFRQHPLELVYMPTIIGFTTGLAFSLATHFVGQGSDQVGVTGISLILIAHMFTFHHLRHSHIHMPFTGIMGKLLHSPMHHIIHHSDNPAHFDRNMGYMFSIWDWMAGTLYVPHKSERVTLGIGHEGALHDTVGNSFWLPVRNAGRILKKRFQRRFGQADKQEI